jgi:hypothetical protein
MMSDEPRQSDLPVPVEPTGDDAALRLERVVDDLPSEENEDPASGPHSLDDASELDARRIQRLATLRRSTYRARSHAVILTIAAAVVTVQLVMWSWVEWRLRGPTRWLAVYAALAPLSLWGTAFFYRRALRIHRETTLRSADSGSSVAMPDFDPLSDGSQRWQSLDDVR